MKTLSVYIHIPFCVQKCKYCDFLSAPATKPARQQYIEALKKEIMQESLQYVEYSVDSVFFGGGTPSILDGEQIAECMDVLRSHFHMSPNAEITMEMNPGTADLEKLTAIKEAGINRLSIGLQSTDNAQLKMLGRIHTYEQFLAIYEDARRAGFDNINIDLMSALPGQTQEDWELTLQRVVALHPEHISAYSLIIEEGTPLYRNLEQYPPIPDEEEDRKMYVRTKELLAQAGYYRYEISNYARKRVNDKSFTRQLVSQTPQTQVLSHSRQEVSYECRHNSAYWIRSNYAGFGLGASSMVDNYRWKNTDDMQHYIELISQGKSVKEDKYKLSMQECMEEFMYLGLRMMKGVSEQEFEQLYGQPIDDVYKEVLDKWQQLGYLCRENGRIRLTDKGIDVSNVILADFLLD